MSTAGKVLVVLVALLIPVWAILMSGVAEYNRSGGRALAKLQKDVEKLQSDLVEVRSNVQRLQDKISLEQVAAGKDMAVIRAKQADIEHTRAAVIEDQSRSEIALADGQKTLKNAELERDFRVAEKKELETELAKDRADVEKLKSVHAELTQQLGKLRKEFKDTYESNRAKVRRLAPQ